MLDHHIMKGHVTLIEPKCLSSSSFQLDLLGLQLCTTIQHQYLVLLFSFLAFGTLSVYLLFLSIKLFHDTNSLAWFIYISSIQLSHCLNILQVLQISASLIIHLCNFSFLPVNLLWFFIDLYDTKVSFSAFF